MSDSIFTIIGRSTRAVVGNKLDIAGGTMQGPLLLSGVPSAALEAVSKDYVDTAIANLTDYARLDGADFTGDLSGTNLILSGNLTVQGTTTTLDTANTTITDSLLALSKGAGLLTNAVNDSGILIERGSSEDNVALFWDEADERFKMSTTSSDATATDLDATSQSANLEIADLRTNGVDLGTVSDFLGGLLLSSSNVTIPKTEFDAQAVGGVVTLTGDSTVFPSATITVSFSSPSEVTYELEEVSDDGTDTTVSLQVVQVSQQGYTHLISTGGKITVGSVEVTFS
jgi:hypothetical protein